MGPRPFPPLTQRGTESRATHFHSLPLTSTVRVSRQRKNHNRRPHPQPLRLGDARVGGAKVANLARHLNHCRSWRGGRREIP
jgi:hypothetical protein